MGKESPNAPITIKSINPFGLFADTKLQIAMMILCMNHVHFWNTQMPENNKLELMDVLNTLGNATIQALNPTMQDYFVGRETRRKMAAATESERRIESKQDDQQCCSDGRSRNLAPQAWIRHGPSGSGSTSDTRHHQINCSRQRCLPIPHCQYRIANTALQVGMMIVRINHLYFWHGQMPKEVDLIPVLNQLLWKPDFQWRKTLRSIPTQIGW